MNNANEPSGIRRFPIRAMRVTLAMALAAGLGGALALSQIGAPVARLQAFAVQDAVFSNLNDIWADAPGHNVVSLLDLVEDGEPIGDKTAYKLSNTYANYTSKVGSIDQNTVMPGGCEIVSLAVALESMGFDVAPSTIADGYLEVDGSFAHGYSGDPYELGAGYPPGIVAAANGYLSDQDTVLRAHDATGTSFQALKTLANHGYPVIVWTTMGFADPNFTGETEDGVAWYDNEHCVVMYGVRSGKVLVSDPLEGLVERDEAEFERIYWECGSMSVLIH